MYLLYSEHPKTLVKTPISLYKNYLNAIKSLREAVTEYITNTHGYQTIIYISNVETAIKDYPETKYFVHVNEEYNNLYQVYERRTTIIPGFFRNGTKETLEARMYFSIMDISMLEYDPSQSTTTTKTPKTNLQILKQPDLESHNDRAKMITELQNWLHNNKLRFKHLKED